MQFRGCEKDIFGKQKQKKTEEEKGKVLYWPSSTVCSNCSNFKIYEQNDLKSLYCIVSLLYWVEPFQTVALNISLTKKSQKLKGIVTRQAFIYILK